MAYATFRIDWSWDELVAPGSAVAVPNKPSLPINGADRSLEARLSWPEGTLAMLRHAFERGLGRRHTWRITEPAQEQAVAVAARVYRRGVAVEEQAQSRLSGSYEVQIFSQLDLAFQPSGFVVCDVGAVEHVQASGGVPSIVWEPSELQKNLETVATLLESWRDAGSPTHWQIVGGGILSDTAAFAATLVDCTFEFVPTTLLAMADACVGGKTGVNFPPYGKNQIGRFAFPTRVSIAPHTLSTLPSRHLLAGMAECIKHAMLSGDRLLAAHLCKIDSWNDDVTCASLLQRVIKVKADVVSQDPTEAGLRASLNLGHTLGHALEAICHDQGLADRLYHGEAVAVGLRFQAHLSHHLGLASEQTRGEFIEQLNDARLFIPRSQLESALGCDLSDPKLEVQLRTHVSQDKKMDDRADGALWVLLEDWGKLAKSQASPYLVPVSWADFLAAWRTFAEDY